MANTVTTLVSGLWSTTLRRKPAIATIGLAMALAGAGATGSFAVEGDPGFRSSAGGYDLKLKPYIEMEAGYDSNPDSLVAQDGSSFEKVEGGVRATAEGESDYYELNLKVRDVRFNDLDRENRWEIKAALDAAFELNDAETLKLGGGYFRDFFSLDRANIYDGYADYAWRSDDVRLKLLTLTHVEENLGNDGADGDPVDIFNATRNEAFDFYRQDARISLLTFARQMVQPFAIYDIAGVDYFNQVSDPLIDRNAFEQYGVVGLRFQFSDEFRIDVGGRFNDRRFDDDLVDQESTSWVDVNVFWKPVDEVRITGILERVMKEPSTSFGVADDVRTVGMTFDWRFRSEWNLSLNGYYDRVEPFGDDLRFDKYYTTAILSYEPHANLELFLSALGKWVSEEVTGDSYDRYKIGAGARLQF